MKNAIISPSILSADFANLGKEVSDVLAAGAGSIHFDVMDHHFVPNLTFGAPICKSLRDHGITAFIDVHLMVNHPENFIDEFAQAGASLLAFHPETTADVDKTLDKIIAAGMQAGLAFNPDKPVDITPAQLEKTAMILIMSVFPGFGGQGFIPEVLNKIANTRRFLDAHHSAAYLAVDGGIKVDNIGDVAKAGADFFVVGSGLFSAENYPERMQALISAFSSYSKSNNKGA